MSQETRGEAFAALHRGEPFLIPNPWDAGSARMLEALGFRALATTSSGFAFTLGRPDGGARLDEVTAHVGALTAATSLPVSVDLESGGEDPALAIRWVAEAGAVGGSIEDWDPDTGLYEPEEAADRLAKAADASRGLGFPFLLCGRAENHLRGNPDLDDTIKRLQAYEAAGADVVYAPGLRTVEEIGAVCSAVRKPVNVLAVPSLLRRDRGRGRPARQRRRGAHLGRCASGHRRRGGAAGGRPAAARGPCAARRVVRLTMTGAHSGLRSAPSPSSSVDRAIAS